jgi:hypothetical protein
MGTRIDQAPGGSLTTATVTGGTVLVAVKGSLGYNLSLDTLKTWLAMMSAIEDDGWVGPEILGVAGENITQWDILYVKPSEGGARWWKYDADAIDKAKIPKGVALAAASSEEAFRIGTPYGIGRNLGWSMTVNQDEGKEVYASTTAGAITLTIPSTAGDIVVPVGFVLDANYVHFTFGRAFVEVPTEE